jgi:hypothetical protein
MVGVPGAASLAARETLDRVVASIGNVAVTESDVEAEYRFALFQEGRPPDGVPDSHDFEQSLQRLIDQRLLSLEAQSMSLEAEGLVEQANTILGDIRTKFGSEEAFRDARRALGMTDQTILERLTEQARILRLIDQRLRPAAWVEPAEIEAYYRTVFLPEHARRRSEPPPRLEEVETEIREILVQRKMDQLLSEWLEELRANYRVEVQKGNNRLQAP